MSDQVKERVKAKGIAPEKAPEEGMKFPYPGIPGTADGTSAVVHVEIRATECAAAYPITSSTQMGMGYQAAYANGFKNVWGAPIGWLELESEHSSASACEGYALAGGRVSNYTSGQGLILMKEVLYVIAGKRLPMVLNVAARALTSHALNVHAGHDDVFGVTDCGWGMLFAKNVQDIGDLSLISRRASEDSLTPFMNIQDGFLTSHTIENCLFPEDDLIREYLGNPRDKIRKLFDPEFPLQSGVVQNQDSYMSGKVAQRAFYDQVPRHLQNAMDEFYRLTGRRYQFIESVGMEDAEYAVVSIGSTAETAMASVPYIRSMGYKVGVVNLTAFRPFPAADLVNTLKNVKAIAVIERLDVPLAVDNPVTAELEAAFAKGMMGLEGFPRITRVPKVYSGSAGLGSRDVTPGHIFSAVRNMAAGEKGKRYFTLGIDHQASLPMEEEPDVRPPGSFSIRGHSVGGFGSVTTNKVIATMLGDIFGFSVQASPKYGSEKKGLPTNTYLTKLQQVEFVPLMDPNTWNMGNPLVGLRDGGIVFQHTDQTTPRDLWGTIPDWGKYFCLEHNIRMWGVDTIAIARESCKADASLVQRFQGIVLLGVFLRVTPFKDEAGLGDDDLFKRVEEPLRHYFGKRGEAVVQENVAAAKRGYTRVFEIPRSVMEATDPAVLAKGKEEWDAKGKDVNAFFI
ncbi:MAG: 2-oxoacid:acceptor oxidoreductase family protein [Nitrospirae bacterium]|nr:2-oxoacid:acceptor oxidoreductase family protein [Nitrospirota bacterium]